jgi:hypothetical protein
MRVRQAEARESVSDQGLLGLKHCTLERRAVFPLETECYDAKMMDHFCRLSALVADEEVAQPLCDFSESLQDGLLP